MVSRLRRRIPSLSIPVARRRIRALELVLALGVVLPLVGLFVSISVPTAVVELSLIVAFLSPPVLAVVTLVGALDDGLGLASVSVSILAAITLGVAALSLYTLLYPPEGGGVYGGHLLTYVAGLGLALAVLARTGLAHLWSMRCTRESGG